jgi:hypothetical protein
MDIDIDCQDRSQVLDLFKHIPASRQDRDGLVKHNTGVYLHAVPVDAVKGMCAVPYQQAEQQHWFKIDFLNVGIYQGIRDEQHLTQLMNQEPMWELLEENEFVKLLFHINAYGNVLKIMKPTSISQLAAVIAMIRPAKKYLIGKSWDQVNSEIWTTPTTNEYFWKKSHAFAYATAIVVQMNLICEGLTT